jgi:glucokinase
MKAKKTTSTKAPAPAGVTLGIDLGGTKILAGIVDASMKVTGRGKVKTPFQGDEKALTDALLTASDMALKEAGKSRADVTAVAVAAPGPIDKSKGLLLRANNLAVKGFSVPKLIGRAFPNAKSVKLENDVRLAALGEARMGAGKGSRCLVAVWVGTGVGGAVLFDGKLWTGRNQNAGEIGQTQLDFRRAIPGKPDGTFEAIAAKVGITSYLRKKIDGGGKTSLKKVVNTEGARLKGSQLKEALEQGDELTKRAVARSAKAVGMVIANTFNVLSPDLFVLGGGVGTDLGDGYLSEVRKWAKDFAFTTELGSVEVVPAALGDDAGILGAAIFANS